MSFFRTRGSLTACLTLITATILPLSTQALDLRLVSGDASGSSSGTTGAGTPISNNPSMSADGRFVVFKSFADNLDQGGIVADNDDDTDSPQNLGDVFIWDKALGTAKLIGVNVDGDSSGDGTGSGISINAAGTKVAYTNDSQNLDAEDIPATPDGNADEVYIYDVASGNSKFVTANFDASLPATGDAEELQVGNNGKVFFTWSSLSLLDADEVCDINGSADIFVYDEGSSSPNKIELVTKSITPPSSPSCGSASEASADSGSDHMMVSADGSKVVFESGATDLAAGQNETAEGDSDIFLWDNGTITLISKTTAGSANGPGNSRNPIISADGSTIAFESDREDLTTGPTGSDNNGSTDVYVWKAGIVTLASADDSGNSGSGTSVNPSLSDDGNLVTFESNAPDLTPLDNQFTTQIYLRNIVTFSTTMLSLAQDGLAGADGGATNARISGNGLFVTFSSQSSDLTGSSVPPTASNIFVRDIAGGANYLMSSDFANTGSGGDLGSYFPDRGSSAPKYSPLISQSGLIVTYLSGATDLVASGVDTNGTDDIFQSEFKPGIIEFSDATYTVDESAGQATITVERTGGTDGEASVTFSTADDSANQPADYASNTNTLTWTAGESGPKTFTVDIVDDEEAENDETVSLKLENATGSALGAQDEATLTISDDDEDCFNDVDDNANGDVDCADADCAAEPTCVEDCDDTVDNDDDGDVDCDDAECAAAPGCFEICANGNDDDGNGQTDCADSACSSLPVCTDPTGDGDGDGAANGSDNCASVSNPLQEDSDGDGVGNACDSFEDDCSNGVSDDDDALIDCADANCTGDAACLDTDADGIPDVLDNCDAIVNPGQQDTDGDGIGNACDSAEGSCNNGADDDGDTLVDCLDTTDCGSAPACAAPGSDDDGDGVNNAADNCPSVSNAGQQDSDGDGIGNACDTVEGNCGNGVNDDSDGAIDCADSDCSLSPLCSSPGGDTDGDGVANNIDNCPAISNAGQEDTDSDGIGNVCDTVEDDCDNGSSDDTDAAVDCLDPDCSADPACAPVATPVATPTATPSATPTATPSATPTATPTPTPSATPTATPTPTPTVTPTASPTPSATPIVTPTPGDTDGDTVPNGEDNCPDVVNPGQEDSDQDGIGNACDPVVDPPSNGSDDDGDGVANSADNCPTDSNADQEDTDGDGLGNECDALPTVPGVPPIAGGGCQLNATSSATASSSGMTIALALAGISGLWFRRRTLRDSDR